MRPKGVGPQKLGVGQMGATCGCGVPKNCNCGGSPTKLVGFAVRTLKKVGDELIGKGDLKRRNQYNAD